MKQDGSPEASSGTEERLPYEPPMVKFLPLKTEEKLLACVRFTRSACGESGPFFNS